MNHRKPPVLGYAIIFAVAIGILLLTNAPFMWVLNHILGAFGAEAFTYWEAFGLYTILSMITTILVDSRRTM